MKTSLPIVTEEPQSLEAHRGRLLRYIRSIVRDAADAEDVLQEVLLRAAQRRDTLRAREAATTWLFRIATHACLDHLRQRARRPRPDPEIDLDEVEVESSEPPSLQAALEREEMSACVQRFLERLPDNYRSVLILSDLEELTGNEIAEALGVPLTSVKMRLHRARRLLQADLETGCAFSCDARGVLVCEPK